MSKLGQESEDEIKTGSELAKEKERDENGKGQ